MARSAQSEHLFVSNIRFWSIAAVLLLHSLSSQELLPDGGGLFQQVCANFVKFGTICFFLISGFLLGERIESAQPWPYLRRRIQKIAMPWAFWLGLTVLYRLLCDGYHHRFESMGFDLSRIVLADTGAVLRGTAFWFVPNLLVGMAVLLVLRKRLRDWRLGAALLAVNLVYVANIYRQWFDSIHTEALFAFAFYLWLGAYAAIRGVRWLERVPVTGLAVAACVAMGLSLAEMALLRKLGSPDPVNTLRLSNQALSVAVCLLLAKVRGRSWPRFVDARAHTFGLYLTHTLVLDVLYHFTKQLVRTRPWVLSGMAGRWELWLATAGLCFAGSLGLTMLLLRGSWTAWMVGGTADRRAVKVPVLVALPSGPPVIASAEAIQPL